MSANKVIVIDGNLVERAELTEILEKSGYEILGAATGSEGGKLIAAHLAETAAIFLRLDLPDIPGNVILRELNHKGITLKVPVTIIEGEEDEETPDEIFEMGVIDFARRPFRSKMVQRRLKNAIRICRIQGAARRQLAVQNDTMKKQNEELQSRSEDLKRSRNGILETLGTVVEYRNLEYSAHARHVHRFTEILGLQVMADYPELGLTKEKVETYAFCSMLHDIGKICITDAIMLKPGRLTDSEREIMESHTTKGCEMLDSVADFLGEEYFNATMAICRSHHERYDGKGYPDGLEGDDIPLSAQLVSIADAYDGLVGERVYKKAYSKQRAFEMITFGECGVFHPKLLESFRKCRTAFEAEVNQDGMELAADDSAGR